MLQKQTKMKTNFCQNYNVLPCIKINNTRDILFTANKNHNVKYFILCYIYIYIQYNRIKMSKTKNIRNIFLQKFLLEYKKK